MVMKTQSGFGSKFLVCIVVAVLLVASDAVASDPSGLPQNAALVYYQACLFRQLYLKPPAGFNPSLSTTAEADSNPSKTITAFVRSPGYQFLIELVTVASRLPQCDWG
jgi:hypothetical protein